MRSALKVADILRRHGDTYRAIHGGHVEACEDCGHGRIVYNSCRNRHCPKCQGLAPAAWLADRQADLLDVPYFHVVFTRPAKVAAIAYQNKAKVYAMLFKAGAETLCTTATLHTWGQTLGHHPHLHCVVPGGGLTPAGPEEIERRLPAELLSAHPCALTTLSAAVPGTTANGL